MPSGLPASIATQVITILRPQMIVDHGTSVPDWTLPPAETVNVPGCSVQPATGSDNRTNRDAIESVWDVWVPLGTVVGVFDRVIVDGYSSFLIIDGQPEYWGVGRLEHQVLHLVSWKG